mmetsp:Transcript_97227/g.208557  ORF Transcript_97227/g.208557 Transcript_97227/m.208557 type:complete len:158 (-) Transcript_97227:69-542(-)
MGANCGCEDKNKDADMRIPALPSHADQVLPGGDRSSQDGRKGVAASFKAGGSEPTEEPEPPPKSRTFEFTIHKTGPEDKLGMDVKHINGRLEVVHIFADGCVERTNQQNKAHRPPRDALTIGDVVQKVNNIDSSDHQMVAECRLRNNLTFTVMRAES